MYQTTYETVGYSLGFLFGYTLGVAFFGFACYIFYRAVVATTNKFLVALSEKPRSRKE